MCFIKKFNFENDKTEWNLFIKTNSDGHFFFETDYLFYHQERFEDFSLLLYDRKKDLICVLPACFENMDNKKTLHSHKGLTFGGFVFKDKLSFLKKRKIVFACLDYLKKNDFNTLIIKLLPSYFFTQTNESIHRILNDNLLESKILRVEANSVINLPKNKLDYHKNNLENYSKRKKRNLQKAFKSNLKLEKTKFSVDFWQIIEENLKTHHNLSPVHQAAEIQLLHDKFPQHIYFFVAKDKINNNKIVACSVIFIYQNIIHLQYMAATKEGKKINALDFMIDEFIKNYSIYFDSNFDKEYTYLSLGVSELRNQTEKDTNSINEGLFKWKEEFNAKTVSHFVYQLGTTDKYLTC